MARARKKHCRDERTAEHSCWKCGTPPLTDRARETIRKAARREILRLIDRQPMEGIGRGPISESDKGVAQLLLKGHDVNGIVDELLEPPTVIIQSLLRLTLLRGAE